MSFAGRKVDTKVYIEGHLIPSAGINITLYDGQTSQCMIDTTPIEATKKIPPMSTVTIFYYDDNYGTWCLLWEGFYVGWQFSRSSGSRSITLSALDWTGLYQKINALYFGKFDSADTDVNFDLFSMGTTKPVTFGKSNTSEAKTILKGASELFLQSRLSMNHSDLIQTIIDRNDGNLNFGSITEDLIESFLFLSPLVYYRYLKSKMKNKFTSVKDENLKEFFSADLLNNQLFNITSSEFNMTMSFDKLIAHWEAACFYTRSSICAPPFAEEAISTKTGVTMNQNGIYQNILHPRSFSNIPPTCNLLFPEMIDSISYARNYISETTRMMTRTMPVETGVEDRSTGFFYSERSGLTNSSKILNEMFGLSQNIFLSHFSEDEYAQYVQPLNYVLFGPEYSSLMNIANAKTSGSKEAEKVLQKLIGAITHYSYVQARYGNRPVTVSGSFNPYAVVAFPMMIFDEANSFTAKPMSITHSISASGSARTQYMCNYAIDFTTEDLRPGLHSKFPRLSGLLPNAWQPENIDNTYASLLGRNPFGHAAVGGFGKEGIENLTKQAIIEDDKNINTGETGIGVKSVNTAVIANAIFNIDRSGTPSGSYDKATDKADFARKSVLRSVTTLAQYNKFYNMSGPSHEPPEVFEMNDQFRHIISIRESGSQKDQGVLILVDVDRLKKGESPDQYIDDVANDEGSGQALTGNPKYRTMDAIQEAMKKVAFRG